MKHGPTVLREGRQLRSKAEFVSSGLNSDRKWQCATPPAALDPEFERLHHQERVLWRNVERRSGSNRVADIFVVAAVVSDCGRNSCLCELVAFRYRKRAPALCRLLAPIGLVRGLAAFESLFLRIGTMLHE